MRHYKFGSALLITMILVGCGGGGSDIPAKPKFTSQVSFGDSLSDVGSYKVGNVNTAGGGQFTINVAGKPTNWTEFMAISLGLPSLPCAAWKGLNDGTTIPSGKNVAVASDNTCTGYAQGGARVANDIGIHNYQAPVEPGSALTYSVNKQIQEHLIRHGNFTGNEVVTIMAGANDLLAQLDKGKKAGADAVNAAIAAQVQADIQSGTCFPNSPTDFSNCIPGAVATLGGSAALKANVALPAAAAYYANATNQQAMAGEMVAAATALAGYVNNLITAKAKYIVVPNIPDVASTPSVKTNPSVAPLVNALVGAFNTTLKTALAAKPEVLLVDAFTASKDEVANPAKYNLTDATHTACNLAVGVNPLATATQEGSSLVCNLSNLSTGVTPANMGGYLFADTVHPTPYGHLLFATYVLQAMTNKGWY